MAQTSIATLPNILPRTYTATSISPSREGDVQVLRLHIGLA